ncbi:MAG: Nif3-like dinuclear metal center hexameric protein [Thermoflexales bacterium]|nr:Nif3-like dinuclear metal center hexameric protein [Thermoflexales bacterium]
MRTIELITYLNDYLRLSEHEDRSNNGLQVEGAGSVTKVAFAVDACQAAFEAARDAGAQLLITHHGLFWSEVKLLTGPHFKRVKTLLDANVGLYGVHLPLDAHPEVGNNVELCRIIGLMDIQPWGTYKGHPAGFGGTLPRPITLNNLAAKIDAVLGASSRVLAFGPQVVDRVAVCSGGASSFIPQVVAAGFSTYVSGETSHSHYHDAKDYGLNVIYSGHYATETVGLKALARHLETQFSLQTTWLDLPTGM